MWTPEVIIGTVLACLGSLLLWAIVIGCAVAYIHDHWYRHHRRRGGQPPQPS